MTAGARAVKRGVGRWCVRTLRSADGPGPLRMSPSSLTAETIELLQTLIRNRCVNDGTPASGFESLNAELLQQYLGTTGFDVQRFEPFPGRASLVARMAGSDPQAP